MSTVSYQIEVNGLNDGLMHAYNCTEDEFAAFLEAYRSGSLTGATEKKRKITLAEIINLYLLKISKKKGLLVGSSATRNSQMNQFKTLIETIYNKSSTLINFDELTYTDFESFCLLPIASGDTPAENTYNSRLGAVKGLLNFALQERYAVPELTVQNLKYRKSGEELPKYLKLEEVIELLFMALSTRLAIRNHAIIAWLVITGCRISELVNIKVKQIDFDNRIVRKAVRKRGKYTDLYLTDYLVDVIKHYIEIDRKDLKTDNPLTDYLFCNLMGPTAGRKLGTRNLQKMIDNLILKLDIQDPYRAKLTSHSLRHTCGTLALNNGLSIIEVKELLGHCCIQTTMIYTKISTVDLQKKIESKSPFKNVTIDDFKKEGMEAAVRYLNSTKRRVVTK